MGNINKYSNLYNKDNELIKPVNDKGILTDYSIKELEDLVDSLDDGTEKNNAMSMLQQMYANPKTKEDKEYVDQMRKDLLERLKANTSTKKEDVVKSLGEVEEALIEPTTDTNDEYVDYEEVKDDSSTSTEDGMSEQIKHEYKYPTYTNEETAKQFEKIIKEDSSSNKMDNDIRQSITNREDIYRNIQTSNKVVNNIINNK